MSLFYSSNVPELPVPRKVGLAQLQSYSSSVAGVQAEAARIAQMAETTVAVSAGAVAGSDVDSALNASLMGAAAVSNAIEGVYADALEKFEHAAYVLLGERRVIGEVPQDFFIRICRMSESQLLALQRSHGISLEA